MSQADMLQIDSTNLSQCVFIGPEINETRLGKTDRFWPVHSSYEAHTKYALKYKLHYLKCSWMVLYSMQRNDPSIKQWNSCLKWILDLIVNTCLANMEICFRTANWEKYANKVLSTNFVRTCVNKWFSVPFVVCIHERIDQSQ